MRKKLIQTALAVVFFLAVGYTVYTAQNKNDHFSDVMLENVEALADYEWGEGSNNCHMDDDVWLCYPWADGPGCYCGL